MDGRETPAQLTLRKSKEKRIIEAQNGGYALTVDHELDSYPYGAKRKELAAAAFYHTLLEKGSKAARFWKVEAIAEATRDTVEIKAVTL